MLSGSPPQWSTEECEAVADQVGRIFAGEIMRELIAMRKGASMDELRHRWVSVRMTSMLLWWALTLPHNRFVPRLLAFCRAILKDAERNPSIKAYHDSLRENLTKH